MNDVTCQLIVQRESGRITKNQIVLKVTIQITFRALFFSLFITENCLSLAFTVSPKGTFGAFFAFCNHGCSACEYGYQKNGNQSPGSVPD